ncbi:MAG: dihydroneopterin aldolase [Firmicutes bacterium]|nr:dihydroneopterin aldolase [Bacillota bacterium]
MSNMDRIELRQLKFTACHGVYPQEKTNPQPFCLDLTLYLPLQPAAKSGDLALTVNYAELYDRVRNLVEDTTVDLIETLAEQIAELALSYPPVQKVQVALEKSQAAPLKGMPFRAAVVIERKRV